MRPETLSWPTRGSRFVGLLCTITMRRFSAAVPLSFFSPPHEASVTSAIARTIERCFMSGTPSSARGYKRDARRQVGDRQSCLSSFGLDRQDCLSPLFSCCPHVSQKADF